MQPQTVAINGVVTALTPRQFTGITYNDATGTFTIVTPGLYYIAVTLNTAANTTASGAVFALTVNAGTTPAAPASNADNGGQISLIRVQNYAAGDVITINNRSSFSVSLVNGTNQLNSAGHVSIFRFGTGPSGTIITG